MALVPIIQPPIIRALTTKAEREVKMEQLRPVSKIEKILFPIVTTIFVILLIPSSAPLIGMFMLGNLVKESNVVPKITETLQSSFLFIVTTLLGITVGAKANGDILLTVETMKIVILGLIAFAGETAAGVLMSFFGK